MLDYLAAFDTINHITLVLFCHRFGIGGTALKWFLEHREQRVVINGVVLNPLPLSFGVPQGSVLGPLEFILYISSLSDVVNVHSITYVMLLTLMIPNCMYM